MFRRERDGKMGTHHKSNAGRNCMSEAALGQATAPSIRPERAVAVAARSWFAIAAIGQWIFMAYIVAVFFPPIAQHGLEGLKGLHLPAGFREGEILGNLASITHVLLAAVVIGGGPLQLIPVIRRTYPAFHRWLGRSYIFAAVASGIVGLYMTWARSPIGDLVSKLGISGDAVLIIVFAALAMRHAMTGRFDSHRRWALRLFMVASAVWFFRVGLMAWVTITGGVGIDWESFTGPFLYFLGFAQYLLPLAMLEWYFHCQRRASAGMQLAFAGTLFILTALMAVGTFSATMGMWLPRM